MNNNNVHFNKHLNLLMKALNSAEIKCINHAENCLEIFFNDNQKEFILNMLSQIDTCKNSFIFKARKSGVQKEISVTITFKRNIAINCNLLISYINNDFHTYNLNTFNKIDLILDSFNIDNTTLTVQKNTYVENGYLVTFNQQMTKEQFESQENFVYENEELKSRLIHTICTKNEDGTYDVTYGLLYKSENELHNLLRIENKNTISTVKKLKRTLIK